MENTNRQWRHSTVNPVPGRDGCERWEPAKAIVLRILDFLVWFANFPKVPMEKRISMLCGSGTLLVSSGMVNLGQGVAWDDDIGRGIRRNHPEDYAEYVRGSDLASFDIYPVAHDSPVVAGKLWFVSARGRAFEQMGRPEALKAQFKARLLHC